MYVTPEHSRHFDPGAVVDADHRGGVAWSQFNESYDRFQRTRWWRVNRGTRHGFGMRLLRLATAFIVEKRGAILDLAGKARAFARFGAHVPRDPDIVYFGAEAGWEALILRALFGDGGRCVLIDPDPAAHARFLDAPDEVRVRAPRGFPARDLVLRRDRQAIEYVREDLFQVDMPGAFDVGIEWGLIEHFEDVKKLDLMRACQRFLAPGGVEISAVPRNTWAMRLFYRAFRDELNYGYRELMTPAELTALLARGGFGVVQRVDMPTTCLALSRSRSSEG